jgi:hypothetical protein
MTEVPMSLAYIHGMHFFGRSGVGPVGLFLILGVAVLAIILCCKRSDAVPPTVPVAPPPPPPPAPPAKSA